jgi:endonuclease G
MKKNFTRISNLALLTALAVSCSRDEQVAPSATPTAAVVNQDATRDSHLTMGNPSGATTDPLNFSNYLLSKSQFAASYHRDKGKPNWVSWHLSSAWVGSTPRQDNFSADATLPSGWYRVTSSSYTGSGFDRGHECPSADRTGSIADNSATFLMTNMMPQAPQNNQRTWAGLENYCRTLINQGNELYIICGSYGTGGTGSAGYKTTIDAGRVTVPNRCWKVVVVLPEGSSDASRVTTSTRVIAINTPNDNALNTDWGTYRTSVDAIESATGYNILSAVSTAVQDVIEARVDNGPTS